MAKVRVYRYRKYNVLSDDYVVSTRMATKVKIDQIRAEIIPGTEIEIDGGLLTEGWTKKNFDPQISN
jgi:hypothetical protein